MDATSTTNQGSSSALFPMPQAQLLPPPRASLSSLSLSSSGSSHHAPSITNFPILVLTVLGILTTSLLLLAYYVFVIRCCLNWHGSSSSSITTAGARGRRQRQRQRQRAATSSTALPVVSAAAEPRGLDEAAIRALPAFRYSGKKKTPAPAPSECAVCLGEFEDGDRVRLLPGCLHVFHVACIDTWLQGNANCPLCRAHIAAHCLLQLPLLPADHQQLQEVAIQLELLPGAEQEDQATTPQAQQRQAATAPAPDETAGEAPPPPPPPAAAATDNQFVIVVGGQRN
ncbi:hypothetical protein U9M48_021465 [Paspalum notatum var. saurae]|uniref:RING-type E3 ubiquitin transferase n=1 Tax=Paspalum notatum var. saurae TaxID=547442 RepID=A0AAQ3TGD3_PASNO